MAGDVLLKAYHRRAAPQPAREVIFRAQFHTCAVSEKVLGFSRLDLDDACNGEGLVFEGLYFQENFIWKNDYLKLIISDYLKLIISDYLKLIISDYLKLIISDYLKLIISD